MPENPSPSTVPSRRLPVVLGVVAAAGVIGLAGYFGLAGLKRPAGDIACTAAVETAKKIEDPMLRVNWFWVAFVLGDTAEM